MLLGETMITEFTIKEGLVGSKRASLTIECRILVPEKPEPKNVVQDGTLLYLIHFFEPAPAVQAIAS
jgi:hypothetical protein